MPIAFRAAGVTFSGDAPASITLAAPAGTQATDLVFAAFGFSGGTGVTLTPPTGWTLANRINNTVVHGMAVYWGLGGATFGDWAPVGITGVCVGLTLGYTGVDNVTPLDAGGTAGSHAAAAVMTAASVTTVTADALLVGFFEWYDGAGGPNPTFSALFGTHRQQADGIGAVALDSMTVETCDAVQAVAGASGNKTVTSSIAMPYTSILNALRPAAGGGGDVLMAQVCT